MKTIGMDAVVAVMGVGLLAASFATGQNNDPAEVLLGTATHELVEKQVSRIIRILDRTGEQIFGDVCGGYSDEHRARSSHAMMGPAILKTNGNQLDLLGAAPLFGPAGRPAPASSCPSRHCLGDATIVGCCGAFRVVGTDRLGECSILQRCF